MESPIKNFDELLSGMLDGMLSEPDSVELQREMAKNPSLQGRLNELAALRQALFSGRSTESLRPDFARSVSLAAKKRALEMGKNAPEWISPSKTAEPFHKTLASKSWNSVPPRRWIYAGLSLAATLLVAILAIPKADRQGIVRGPNAEKILSNDPIKIPDDSSGLLDSKTERDLATTGSPTIDIPVDSTAVASKREPPTTESVASNGLPVDTVHDLAAKGDGDVKIQDPLSAIANVNQQANEIRGPRKDNQVDLRQEVNGKSVPAKNLYFTLVLDVSIEPQAIENRTLERILEKYDIVSTDDLIVSDEQLKQLEESKLVGNIANNEEKMGVLFLRSTARKLDSAIVDIINRFEDFPEFAMDVTTDQSALLLVNQLGSIRVAEGATDTASRLLLAKAPGRNSPFASSAKRGKPMENPIREKFKGGAVLANPARDEISYVLLLLRPAKKL